MKLLKILFSTLILTSSTMALAQLPPDVAQLQTRWDEVNYLLKDKEQKIAFEQLVVQAEKVVSANTNSTEALIWLGVIKASFAGAKSAIDFSAMSLAKSAKIDFEKALTADEYALQGSSYTNLGVLYYKVPGWPIGFGDEEKAKEYLQKALAIDSIGIENNYFYADYLIEQRQFSEAEKYLLKAKSAPSRLNRPVADKGRQDEIARALDTVNSHLKVKNNASITDRR